MQTLARQESTNATTRNSNLQIETKDIDDDMDCNSGDDLSLNSSESSSSPVSQMKSRTKRTINGASNVLRHEPSHDCPLAGETQRDRDQVDNINVFEMMMNSENTSHPTDAELLGSAIGDEDLFSRKSLDDETNITNSHESDATSITSIEGSEDETVTDNGDFEESDDNEKGSYQSSKRKLFNDNLSYALESNVGRQQRPKSLKSDEESIEAWSIDGHTNSPIEIKIDGKKYMHPPLPAGWRIEISKTHKRPIYIHPDMGRTFHCPVDLPHDVVYVRVAGGKFIKRPKENNREIAPNSPRALRIPESPPSIHDNYHPKNSPRERGESPSISLSHQSTGHSHHRSTEDSNPRRPPPSPSGDSVFQLLRDLSKLRTSAVANSSRNLKRSEQNLESLKNSERKSSGSPSNLSDLVRLYEKEKPLNPSKLNSGNCDDYHELGDSHNSEATDSYMRRHYQTNHASPQLPLSERKSEGENKSDYDSAAPFGLSTRLNFCTKEKEAQSSEHFHNRSSVRFPAMDSIFQQRMNELDETPENVEREDSHFTPAYGKAENLTVPDQKYLRTRHTPKSSTSKTSTKAFESHEKSMTESDEMSDHETKSSRKRLSSEKKLPPSESKLTTSMESEQVEAWFTPTVSEVNRYNHSKHRPPKYVEVATLSHGKARGRSEKPMLTSSINRAPKKSQTNQENPMRSVNMKESQTPKNKSDQSVSSTPSGTLKFTNRRRTETAEDDDRADKNQNPSEDIINKETDDPLQRSFDIHEHATPGKLHWESPNCSGIQPESAAGKSSEKGHVDQKTRDVSSPAERDVMPSTSLSNSPEDRPESPESTHTKLPEDVAETDSTSENPASDSSKQMQDRTEELPGTIGESSGQNSEPAVKGREMEKEASSSATKKDHFENATTMHLTDKTSSDGIGREEGEPRDYDSTHQSFHKNNDDEETPSRSVPLAATNAKVNGQTVASAESPVDFGTFGDEFSDSSDDGYSSTKSTPSLSGKESERQNLDESGHSTSFSVESPGNPSESSDEKSKKPIAETSPAEFDHFGDSDDESTEIPSPRMNSNDEDLQEDGNDTILDEESESSPLIKPKRRKLSWRAWHPPFTLCSLQRLDEIFAEQQKLRKKKREKTVTRKKKTVKKAQSKKAKTKKKSRRG
jgi:hypothetical protein